MSPENSFPLFVGSTFPCHTCSLVDSSQVMTKVAPSVTDIHPSAWPPHGEEGFRECPRTAFHWLAQCHVLISPPTIMACFPLARPHDRRADRDSSLGKNRMLLPTQEKDAR
jgi:hypothetical protein